MSEEIKNEQVIEPVNEQPTVEEPENKPEEKMVTMSQSELNALIGKEKGRVKSKYADYDDIKAKASEYEKQLEEKRLAEMSEKERLEEIAKKHEEEKQSYAKELEALRENIKAEKIRNEFIKVATGNNIGYLDDAFSLADLSAVTIGEDGKVVGMDEAVKALVDNKPFLVAKKQPKPIGESTNGGQEAVVDKTADQLLKDAAAKAKATGRMEDKMAYAKLKAELGK